jgi:hypothetical protein
MTKFCATDNNLDIVDSKPSTNKVGYTTYIMRNGGTFDCPPDHEPITCHKESGNWGIGKKIPGELPIEKEKK